MAVGRSEETALGSAHGRFLESLPRKAIELRGTLAQLTGSPLEEEPREELRRKLQALYASALVFQSDTLAAMVQEGILLLDRVSDEARSPTGDELESLSAIARRIAELRAEPRASSFPPPGTDASLSGAMLGQRRPSTRHSATLTGLLPVGVPQPVPSEMPGRWVSRPSLFGPEARSEGKKPLLQRVLQVLVLASEDALPAFRALLSSDSLRVSTQTSVQEALNSVREDAPDVILAESEHVFEGGLLTALRDDPLTDFLPVVVIPRSDDAADARDSVLRRGADEVVGRPFSTEQLMRVLGRVTGTLVEVDALSPAPEEATLDEVCARVSQEIRRGLIEAAESGRELKVQLGEGAEVMAAAWAAVARVRALFHERSAGRVRFSDRPAPGAPGLLTVSSTSEQLADLAGESPLKGRRILVADDDTAVLFFFAGLLREEGAAVTQVSNGAEALSAARSERPDLIISDIVMPGLSGFALCRELKRDPLLAEVPVILISWKEDLLLRMRELSSGASAYLRKEASAVQILKSVRDALRSRSQLEAELARPGEVRGSLEGTGVVALLRSVRRARPSSRITLRDAWNLFECELREGRIAQLTRTASDGSFVRNEAALPQLLGMSSGRFSVTDADAPLKQAVDGTLDEALSRGARELGAQLDVLSGDALDSVERVVLDEDAQVALLDTAPQLVRDVVARLTQGMPPRQIWQDGIIDRATLESVLLDMAKRGAIRAVLGSDERDLTEAARALRAHQPETELKGPLSLLPAPPDPVISVLPMSDPGAPSSAPLVDDALWALPESARADGSILPPPMSPEDALRSAAEGASSEDSVKSSSAPIAELAAEPDEPANTDSDETALPAATSSSVPPSGDSRELTLAAAEASSSRGTLWAWTAAFVALVAVGFLADRARTTSTAPRLEAIGEKPALTATPTSTPLVAEEATVNVAAPSAERGDVPPKPRAVPDTLVTAEEGGFTIYEQLIDDSVVVAPGQALLWVKARSSEDDAQLAIDGKAVGPLPAKVPVSEGIHELAITRGDSVSYRFFAPRRGATWVLGEP